MKILLINWKDKLKEGEKLTIRKQQCMGCHSVLALQIVNELDKQSQAAYYVVKDCVWLKGEPHFSYEEKCWFGNFIKCPVCGREGKFPIDKPLSWELMQESKEGRNAV